MNHIDTMKLGLEALESCGAGHISDGGNQWYDEKLVDKAITALREALAEQPERSYRQLQDNGSKYFGESWDKAEQPAQGCDHCNHSLYAGTNCKNCGRVTEQAAIKRDLTPEQPAQLPFGVGGGLVAIKTLLSRDPCVHANTAIQMIDAILAEQPAQQEPAAIVSGYYNGQCVILPIDPARIFNSNTALYTSQQPAQRKPLSNGEIYTAYITATNQTLRPQYERLAFAFARAIEAAHGIKENT